MGFPGNPTPQEKTVNPKLREATVTYALAEANPGDVDATEGGVVISQQL